MQGLESWYVTEMASKEKNGFPTGFPSLLSHLLLVGNP